MITAYSELTSASAGLVPVYNPPTGEQESVDVWTNMIDKLAATNAWSDKQTTCSHLQSYKECQIFGTTEFEPFS